jgi:hypothetical protein
LKSLSFGRFLIAEFAGSGGSGGFGGGRGGAFK